MQRLLQLKARINQAAERAGRDPDSIRLLAVSKGHDIDRIRALARAGQTCFGESYVDEAMAKCQALSGQGLEWHFIGPIQSNKTRHLAECFDWVQSVDRLKIVRRLNEQRPSQLPPLNVLIQVNLDAEHQKAGCEPDVITELAAAIAAAPRLRLRGLMAIPAQRESAEQQYAGFVRLRQLFDALAARFAGVDTLSAGMSGDLEAAIAAGSTMVRVGTDLFGARA